MIRDLASLIAVNHGTWRGWVRHLLALADLQVGRLSPFLAADVTTAQRLVFVCLGNINRSAFACAVARQLGESAISIGLSTTKGIAATPAAIKQARYHGIDLSPHQATTIDDYLYCEGDILLVMEVRHAFALRERGVPPAAISFLGSWGAPGRIHLHDPHTLSDDYFATCFALVESAVRRLVQARRGVVD